MENNFRRLLRVFLFIGFAVASACAPTTISNVREYEAELRRPARVLVYNFAVSEEEVRLDRGLRGRLEEALASGPRTAEERAAGHAASETLAEYLARDLQALGLPAERARRASPALPDDLVIMGRFLSVDEGNRTRRLAVGFGAGKTEVSTAVQLWQMTPRGRVLVAEFETDAHSGGKPGMVAALGAGAAASRLGTAAAAGGAAGVAGERLGSDIDADARRTAKMISEEVQRYYQQQRWSKTR